jgi:type II restriction enzyme
MHGDEDETGPGLGFEEVPAHFRGPTQIARIQTEAWASRWLYCPNCGAPDL